MEVLKFNPRTKSLEYVQKGEQGEIGLTGPQGPKGDKGETGPMGPQGVRGKKGERGETGPIGPQGIQGITGINGRNGLDGKDGKDGKNGKDGEQGDPGNMIYLLQSKPDNSFGKDQDWAFSQLGEMFFKQNGKWVYFRSISGGGGGRKIRKIQEIGNVKLSNLQPNDVLMWNGAYWGNEQVSSGTTVNYKQHVDVVSDSITYLGYADPGTSNASALWQIRRITTTGEDLLIEYADGDALFDNVWDDRASLSYS